MKKYSHLLFDLDHTLWDFNTNCKQTLITLHAKFKLDEYNIPFNTFHNNYLLINNKVWELYNLNQISKEDLRNYRFNELLNQFDIQDNKLATELESFYLDHCPRNGVLIPHTKELLHSIHPNYNLSIITNGFQKTQEIKIQYSGINQYFDSMFTSESVGFKKPDKRYFDFVLNSLQIDKKSCLVIGDNPYTDIRGATDYGIDTAWINTQNFPKQIISSYYFKDLKTFSRLFES